MAKKEDKDNLPLLASQPQVAFTYNGVDFNFDERRFVNLTEMWKATGSPDNKDPRKWRSKDGKGFIVDLARSLNVPVGDIIVGTRGKGGSTWAHWQISIAYAKYLSHEFHRLVNEAFKEWAEEKADPGLKIDRGIDGYTKLGYSYEWVDKRLKGKVTHKRLTATMKSLGAVPGTYREVADIGNVKVIGRPAKAIKAERNPATRQTRDSFTESELVATAFYESQTDQTLVAARAYGHDEIVSTALIVGNAVQKAIAEGLRHAQALKGRREEAALTPAG